MNSNNRQEIQKEKIKSGYNPTMWNASLEAHSQPSKHLRYTQIYKYSSDKKDGGVCILLSDSVSFNKRLDLDIFKEGEVETVFIDILTIRFWNSNKPFHKNIDGFTIWIHNSQPLVKSTQFLGVHIDDDYHGRNKPIMWSAECDETKCS